MPINKKFEVVKFQRFNSNLQIKIEMKQSDTSIKRSKPVAGIVRWAQLINGLLWTSSNNNHLKI